ncbi:hypothetical protein ACP70R_045319 [Stipagrostis hirtigluma subsp. patula]
MATGQSSTPSFFNFLKEGVLLPSRNRSLFAAVFVVIVATTSLLLFANDLAIQPLADEVLADVKALNSTNPSSPDFSHLVQEIQDDTRDLLLAGAAYLLGAVVVGSAVRIVVLFAAVTTYSGELHTFGSLLGKARAQLKGPVLTLAFVYVVEIAYVALLTAMAALIVYLAMKGYTVMLLVVYLPLLAGIVFMVYFAFVCNLGVVVAVAEPGCHGAGAVRRAWRLARGKRRRAVVFVAVTGLLAAAFSPVHTLARACAVGNVASGLLLELVYTALMAAVELFGLCAFAAFYYECKGSSVAAATEYEKLSTQEANDA